MQLRKLGVEEELLLVDPETREPAPHAPTVLQHAAQHAAQQGVEAEVADLDAELYRHQLETRTPPVTDLGELRAHLVRRREVAAQAAEAVGLRVMAAGTLPLHAGTPQPTRDDRYLDMLGLYGEIARPAGTCGMHVHVDIDSPEQGVAVIDAIAPWLPLLLAVGANSPFHHGRDTSYASWRSQVWSRWPSAGPTEPFGSLAGYRDACAALIASGAARDVGMLYFDARLAKAAPTVEIRISDVCTDPDDAILVAALTRALVTHLVEGGDRGTSDEGAPWRSEQLRAAQWRAARYGLSERLLDPRTGEQTPARDVLAGLLATVREELTAYDDLDLVTDGIERVLAAGGSVRQRAAFERNGGSLAAVVDDLVLRSAAASTPA
ncbi:glutamate--cysteine ligase [Nocardioides sp. zg-ZUI104]|uniref:carboxylate-amine ligase n=1 Tax=Nocardioides faecalis TaxID=2803858 RepID=UPI001BD1AEA1|nr:glutamate--cysteine ligase [Nocardioides faecalis]MBS4754004.1 glutamate--cysteine ligase [Nocardioides faecalis]